MIEVKTNVKNLIEKAQEEGIDLENIREYLKLTKIPKDNDKEIMDRLYQETNVMPWDLSFFREIDLIIEELNSKDIVEVENVEAITEEQEQTQDIVTDNNEETALVVKENTNIFSKILSFFSKIFSGVKFYKEEGNE